MEQKLTYTIKSFEKLSNYELYDMIRIREEIFILEQDCVYVDCDNNDQVCNHLLVKDDEAIIASLRIVPAGTKYDNVSIGRVVVTKPYRKKGIAEKMLNEAIAFIYEKYGAMEIVLSAQIVIHELYKKVGFKVVSEVYLEDSIDHVKMVKAL